MKRINQIFLGITVATFILIILPSCVMIMESGEDGRSIIYLECLQGMSDTTAISVIAASSKFGYEDSRVLSDVNVTLRAGGRDIPLSNAEVAKEMFPKGAYYTTEKIEGGHTLEITVSGGGFDPVVATTYKPRDLKPFGVRMEKAVIYTDDAEKRVIKVEVTPDDPDIADHYYALVFDGKMYDYTRGEYFYSNLTPILRSDGFIYSSDFGDDLVARVGCSPWSLFDFNQTFYSVKIVPVYLWRGASLMKDGTITVYFDERMTFDTWIRVRLMEVSPEFYRYAKNIEYSEDLTEALIPFVPSSYSYSNVKGGCGIFGAVSGIDGEWMKLPE